MSNERKHVPELVVAGKIAFFFNRYLFPPVKPIIRKEPRIGRNDLCRCGSGKKAKKCCYKKTS